MANGYIPNGDSDFLTWAQNFSTYFTAHAVSMGFTASDATAVNDVIDGFDDSLGQHVAKQEGSRAACLQKDADRGSAEETIRAFVRRIQAAPQVTDEDRQALGITVRDRLRAMALAPMRRPVGSIDTSEYLVHTIRYREEGAQGRARPQNAIGCEVWLCVTANGQPAPTSPEQFTCAGLNSASPFVKKFDGADANKIAHYLLRWATRSGDYSGWSEILSAGIVGM